MILLSFLRELRELVSSPDAWHPLACANSAGRILGEFEQLAPTALRIVPTDSVPVAWNLPTAIRYLLQQWEYTGRFSRDEVSVQKVTLRELTFDELGAAINTMEQRVALDAIDAAIGRYAESRCA